MFTHSENEQACAALRRLVYDTGKRSKIPETGDIEGVVTVTETHKVNLLVQ